MSKMSACLFMVCCRHIVFLNLRHTDKHLWLHRKVIKYLSMDPLRLDNLSSASAHLFWYTITHSSLTPLRKLQHSSVTPFGKYTYFDSTNRACYDETYMETLGSFLSISMLFLLVCISSFIAVCISSFIETFCLFMARFPPYFPPSVIEFWSSNILSYPFSYA